MSESSFRVNLRVEGQELDEMKEVYEIEISGYFLALQDDLFAKPAILATSTNGSRS